MKWLHRYGDDVCITAGLVLIVWATFRLSLTAGLFLLGVLLVGLGWLLARQPRG
jgi:hypothetical protein